MYIKGLHNKERTSQDGCSPALVMSMAYISGNILCSRKQTGTVSCFYSADKGTTVNLQSKDLFHEKVDSHIPQRLSHFPQLWNCFVYVQLVEDLELLAVRANGSTNGIRVLEPASASKGMQVVDKLCFGDPYSDQQGLPDVHSLTS